MVPVRSERVRSPRPLLLTAPAAHRSNSGRRRCKSPGNEAICRRHVRCGAHGTTTGGESGAPRRVAHEAAKFRPGGRGWWPVRGISCSYSSGISPGQVMSRAGLMLAGFIVFPRPLRHQNLQRSTLALMLRVRLHRELVASGERAAL